MKKILQGNEITKSFGIGKGTQMVLNSVSVDILEGEFVAVMGASGSGKSTLLYALSGMDRVDRGEIYFEGENLTTLSDNRLAKIRREKMGFIFQQPTMLKNLNILDNIILPQMGRQQKNVAEVTKKALDIMTEIGIAELAKRDITEVSGGQLQRAGICRALINNPKILFADEPTGALNSKYSQDIMDTFCSINNNGTAILLVTHDVKVAARAKRVLFMQDGKIVSQLIFDDPRHHNLIDKTNEIILKTKELDI